MLNKLKRNDLRRRLGEFKDKSVILELLDTCDAVEKKETVHVVLNHKGQVDVWSTGRCIIRMHELAPDQQFDSDALPIEYGLVPVEIANPKTLDMESWFDYSMNTLQAAGLGRQQALEITITALAQRYHIRHRDLDPKQTALTLVAEEALAEAKANLERAEVESLDDLNGQYS